MDNNDDRHGEATPEVKAAHRERAGRFADPDDTTSWADRAATADGKARRPAGMSVTAITVVPIDDLLPVIQSVVTVAMSQVVAALLVGAIVALIVRYNYER